MSTAINGAREVAMAVSVLVAALAALALPRAASAQDWGLAGAWEQVIPSSGSGPAGFAWHHPTTVAGTLVFSGSDPATGANTSFALDAASLAWTQYPDLPAPGIDRGGPFSFTIGGLVVLTSENHPNALFVIDSSNPAAQGWRALATSGAPEGRDGQRYIEWGGVLYFVGGFQSNGPALAGTPHNDVWALDLTQALAAGAPTQAWVQCATDNVPGLPSARVGFTFVTFNVGAMLFGGVALLPGAPAGSNPYNCYSATFVALGFCTFHQHVHAFMPHNRQPAPGGVTAAQWLQLGLAGANGGPVPTGRFEHAAGAFGDQLFVYGGVTALGLSSEMWAYNLHFQTWGKVVASSPWPSNFFGTGAWLGRSFWILTAAAPNPTPGQPPQPNILWRWSPGGAPGGGGGGGQAAAAATIEPGTAAGLAIAILLGVANLAFAIFQARKAGGSAYAPASSMGAVYEAGI